MSATLAAVAAHAQPTPAVQSLPTAGAMFGPQEPASPDAFARLLDSQVGQVDGLQHQADDAMRLLASGEQVDLHGTMIALEKADIALRTMVSVRDKLVNAYEQVMNMAI